MPKKTLKTGKENPKKPHGHKECGICSKPRKVRKDFLELHRTRSEMEDWGR